MNQAQSIAGVAAEIREHATHLVPACPLVADNLREWATRLDALAQGPVAWRASFFDADGNEVVQCSAHRWTKSWIDAWTATVEPLYTHPAPPALSADALEVLAVIEEALTDSKCPPNTPLVLKAARDFIRRITPTGANDHG